MIKPRTKVRGFRLSRANEDVALQIRCDSRKCSRWHRSSWLLIGGNYCVIRNCACKSVALNFKTQPPNRCWAGI